jgi:hypothetical protein
MVTAEIVHQKETFKHQQYKKENKHLVHSNNFFIFQVYCVIGFFDYRKSYSVCLAEYQERYYVYS